MSDIPEKFMTAARDALALVYDDPDHSENYHVNIIARALMAADEAATKRERERCAGIVLDRMPATQDMNPVTDALEDVYALLKGEA